MYDHYVCRVHFHSMILRLYRGARLLIQGPEHRTGWWFPYPSEKYEFVNGKDDIPYMKWKIKAMFETTKQRNVVDVYPCRIRPLRALFLRC